mmetsp:Transcript_32705/g.79176  ORF Transcript_32705/g.79176 Transcript_32705/m.79176 type:complete len:199 (+) Transcript_32705:142-738(+)
MITRLPSIARIAILSALVLCHVASALSAPSPLKEYHFGATAATASKRVTASDLRRKQPTSYVPDGLTEEQYRQIKNDEIAQQQAMNFGAWGSRFSQTDGDPDGNWFNLPSLWTGGFSANDKSSLQNSGSDKKSADTRRGIANSLAAYLRRYGLAYFMMLLSMQLLTRSLSAKKNRLVQMDGRQNSIVVCRIKASEDAS